MNNPNDLIDPNLLDNFVENKSENKNYTISTSNESVNLKENSFQSRGDFYTDYDYEKKVKNFDSRKRNDYNTESDDSNRDKNMYFGDNYQYRRFNYHDSSDQFVHNNEYFYYKENSSNLSTDKNYCNYKENINSDKEYIYFDNSSNQNSENIYFNNYSNQKIEYSRKNYYKHDLKENFYSNSTTSKNNYNNVKNDVVEIPPLLKDMKIIRTIGAGTFGRVFLVKYHSKYYALKRINKSFLLKNHQLDHLYQEKKALSDLFFCKYFVRLITTFSSKSAYFFLMEYVPGGELFYWLRKYNKFILKDAKFFSAEIILALEYLFNKKLIYRDLKPENILLTADGHIKLIDLGFAKPNDNLTFTICGTPEYMAPEKLMGKGYNMASDIWTYGILLYEMLKGVTPFYNKKINNNSDFINIYDRIINDPVNYHNIDLIAKDLLEKLLEKDPQKRIIDPLLIKNHIFFDNIFDNLENIIPPIIPHLENEGDSKYFIKHEEIENEKGKRKPFYSFY